MQKYLVTWVFIVLGGILYSGTSSNALSIDHATFSAATSARNMPVAASEAKPEPPPGPLTGKIVQTMDSGSYTYLLIDSQGERRWVAINSAPVKVGEVVTVKPGATMFNFSSKSLNRTFERIIFSDGLETSSQSGKKMLPKTTMGSNGATVPFAKITVDKASGPNAYRIATLYANQKLDGKKVTVRGKVVKVSSGIMERNWIHLQDGSGTPQKKNHNLVITSKDLPDVGDIVTITGTLIRNKDFGSGYKYDIIVEKAKVIKDPEVSTTINP